MLYSQFKKKKNQQGQTNNDLIICMQKFSFASL